MITETSPRTPRTSKAPRFFFRRCCRWNGETMGNLWEIYGKSMGNLWEIYGKSMGNPWEIYGKSMGNLWEISHETMENMQFPMGNLWETMGNFEIFRLIWLWVPWDMDGISRCIAISHGNGFTTQKWSKWSLILGFA